VAIDQGENVVVAAGGAGAMACVCGSLAASTAETLTTCLLFCGISAAGCSILASSFRNSRGIFFRHGKVAQAVASARGSANLLLSFQVILSRYSLR
jgi:hypothetical protein